MQFVGDRNPQWGLRWVKMALEVFKLPGWESGAREPHLLPDQVEIERFGKDALALDIPKINGLGRAAGLL